MKIYSFLIRPGWNFLKPEFPQKLHLKISNHTHVKKVGRTFEFLFGIYWWNLKTTIYLKKLLKWANKKKKVLIFTMSSFFKKNKKKTPGYIIILLMCTKNHNHMMYGSWDFLSLLVIFCPLTPLTTRKIKILNNWKKHLEILSFYTCAS